MDRWVGSVALVTGASSGIGEAVVEKLAEAGVKVVGVARRKEKLDIIAKKLSSKNGKFFGFKGDVSKEEDILEAFKWTKKNVGPVSILVNNAGVLPKCNLSSSPTSNFANVLNVNVLAVAIATREAITQMKENNIDGHIIHINSIAGHKVANIGDAGLYSASKYAVTAMAETLRFEFSRAGSKTKITSISPGIVKTEMFDSNMASGLAPELQAQVAKMPQLKPEDIANSAMFVLATPKHVQILRSNNTNNRWIGRGDLHAWPARSPYFNTVNYYLWGHLKSIVYASEINTRDELIELINDALQ